MLKSKKKKNALHSFKDGEMQSPSIFLWWIITICYLKMKSKPGLPSGRGARSTSVAPQQSGSQAIWSGPATALPAANGVGESFISVEGAPPRPQTLYWVMRLVHWGSVSLCRLQMQGHQIQQQVAGLIMQYVNMTGGLGVNGHSDLHIWFIIHVSAGFFFF